MLVELLTGIFASSSTVRPDGLFQSRLQQQKTFIFKPEMGMILL